MPFTSYFAIKPSTSLLDFVCPPLTPTNDIPDVDAFATTQIFPNASKAMFVVTVDSVANPVPIIYVLNAADPVFTVTVVVEVR